MSEILPDLPQEIISDILLRLPVKSIGRSRCVSKPWLSLLTSYQFVKAHLAHHTHSLAHEQNLLLNNFTSLFNLTLPLGVNRFRKLEFFDEPEHVLTKLHTLLGSCNGLILVEAAAFGVLCLINCLTQEYVKLPALYRQSCLSKYGFGYDSLSDDYKIVSISAFVSIYSLKLRCWRRFGTSPYAYNTLNYNKSGVFVNGALHWARLSSSDNDSPIIVAFDLSCEKFYEIPAPVSIDNSKFRCNKLLVIDGCLGLAVELSVDVYAEIWFMKSYSKVESWTRLMIDMEFTDHWYPHCFHNGKLLFSEAVGGILKWYHLQDGRVEVCLLTEDSRYNFIDGITYSPSLVSPHFNYQN